MVIHCPKLLVVIRGTGVCSVTAHLVTSVDHLAMLVHLDRLLGRAARDTALVVAAWVGSVLHNLLAVLSPLCVCVCVCVCVQPLNCI